MDNIPSNEQFIIDELVEFWQTYNEPGDLFDHIRGAWSQGFYSLIYFFLTVRSDLCADKRSKFAASTALEFRQFLEAEYWRLYPLCVERLTEAQDKAEAERLAKLKVEKERQAQIRAETEHLAQMKAENEKRARAEFYALGKLMIKTTDRRESMELARKRQDLATHTGITFVYENHCWRCKGGISSTIHPRCFNCRWYICSHCGSCDPDCNKTSMSVVQHEADDPFLPNFPDE